MCPKLILLDHLGSSFLVDQDNVSSFWIILLMHIELGKAIRLEIAEELIAEPMFCGANIKIGKKAAIHKKLDWHGFMLYQRYNVCRWQIPAFQIGR